MHACLLVRSFIRWLVGWLAALFYPCMHPSIVCACVLSICIQSMPYHYTILHVDGDKRCETFLNCQIGGGRWFGEVWARARGKRERTRASQHVYSVCLMRRSLMCIVYVMVILVFLRISLRKKWNFFPFSFLYWLCWQFCSFWLIPYSHINCSHEWRLLTFWVGGIFSPSQTKTKSPHGRVSAIENEWW